MTNKKFFKSQVFARALLLAAIISPLSSLAGTNSKQATIEFALGTNEVIVGKAECASSMGGNITGIGTGSITVNGESESLRVLSLTASDCITQLDASHFTAEGNLTLSAGKGNTITALYSTDFSQTNDPTDDPLIFEYKNFIVKITGGTGRFKGLSGSGTVDGMSHMGTGLGFVEGIIDISK